MVDLQNIVALCKRRGFIFQSSEIYGGLSSVFDYGPMGAELKRNIKEAWWRANVHSRDDIYGFDAAILMRPDVWEASGHIASFADLLVECKKCNKRFKVEDLGIRIDKELQDNLQKSVSMFYTFADAKPCPNCGQKEYAPPRGFNLMFRVPVGAVEETREFVFLRPETAQGMFVNFINMLDTMHPKLPFGIAQIGKAFRNEVTIGNFIFRMREFEQMEIEYFVTSKDDDKIHQQWIEERFDWYTGLGIKEENLRKRSHAKEELAHYAKACTDIEYRFGFSTGAGTGDGWAELEGIANRQDFDLKEHAKYSGRDFTYFDEETKTRFLPHIIEPSGGVDRSVLAFLFDAYREEEVKEIGRAHV